MRSKIIFLMLFMLSFTIFHDSLMPLIDEKNKHTDVAHYLSDTEPTQECTDFNEIHSMFHFMAIVTPSKNMQIQFVKRETIPHLALEYSPPLEKTSYKPPIA